MKINKSNLAKALAEVTENYQGKKYVWEELEYHQKMKFECDAEIVIEALRVLQSKETIQKEFLRDRWNQPVNME